MIYLLVVVVLAWIGREIWSSSTLKTAVEARAAAEKDTAQFQKQDENSRKLLKHTQDCAIEQGVEIARQKDLVEVLERENAGLRLALQKHETAVEQDNRVGSA